MESSERIRSVIFFEDYRVELEKHLILLKRLNLIESWHDRMIPPGDEWDNVISEQMEQAHLILLLISPDFLASDYIWDIELKRALERHESGEARIIPIILRESMWSDSPIAKLQALPKDAKPINQWADKDAAYKSIAEAIKALVV